MGRHFWDRMGRVALNSRSARLPAFSDQRRFRRYIDGAGRHGAAEAVAARLLWEIAEAGMARSGARFLCDDEANHPGA